MLKFLIRHVWKMGFPIQIFIKNNAQNVQFI